MDIAERSYERLTQRDLRHLLQLTITRLEDVFARTKVAGLYRNRIIAITLCQGSAQHFVDGRNGVKDLDVWIFFEAGLPKPFPYRANWHVDFGASHLGRHPKDKGYTGRRIDIIGRSIAVRPDDTPESAIARWLMTKTESARLIAQRPIIGLHPDNLFARRLWMPKHSTIAGLTSNRDTQKGSGKGTTNMTLTDKLDMTIHVLRPNNPRREETHGHHSWNLYRPGMTVKEYLSADYDKELRIRWGKSHHTFTGPHRRHLVWDIEHGFVELQ